MTIYWCHFMQHAKYTTLYVVTTTFFFAFRGTGSARLIASTSAETLSVQAQCILVTTIMKVSFLKNTLQLQQKDCQPINQSVSTQDDQEDKPLNRPCAAERDHRVLTLRRWKCLVAHSQNTCRPFHVSDRRTSQRVRSCLVGRSLDLHAIWRPTEKQPWTWIVYILKRRHRRHDDGDQTQHL